MMAHKKGCCRIVAAMAMFIVLTGPCFGEVVSLEAGFARPDSRFGIRCFWWWLNGNVSKQAITRDLEEMKAKGFSGALIFDAGGAEQRGNQQVPEGPMYMSDAWRELFKHAIREADRLDLELSLSIQSGWNLGGPVITPDYAAKMLTWSEQKIAGPQQFSRNLPEPKKRSNYYRDIAVLAYPVKKSASQGQVEIRSSSAQPEYPVALAVDGNVETFWVSEGTAAGQGPSSQKPQWLEVRFSEPTTICGMSIQGRPGYGPKACQLQASSDGVAFSSLCSMTLDDGKKTSKTFEPSTYSQFRLLITASYDPHSSQLSRNVQIAELSFIGKDNQPVFLSPVPQSRPIRDLAMKSMFQELGMSAPDCRFLLEDESVETEPDVLSNEIVDLTDKMDSQGNLRWDCPAGDWVVLRFGYTVNGAGVSTYSGQWKGLVIDYLDPEALRFYWRAAAEPLLSDIGPLAGKTLKYLHTDSWECGGSNWTPNLRRQFQTYREYDLLPYLPVIAGKIVNSRDISNRFLADFRKTLGDCVADHYQLFAELSHEYNMGIHPESGGPHAGPFDAIKCLGRNDMMMGEFWAPSPHRPRPEQRFFVKQSSSAAHIYGKKLVGAESFTTIGPHWEDILWKAQKPSFDHEICSGLNLAFVHTFTCSPESMGIPGQEYFAGTHFNPQVTWWNEAEGIIGYMTRCQYLVQQGQFVADVLYYYGDHVPNLMPLKESDPAGVLPGYDYDVTNEEALRNFASVEDGQIVLKSGMRYRLLVLPNHKVLSLAVLKKVKDLVEQGGIVLGPRPQKTASLVGYPASDAEFKTLADQLWGGSADATGSNTFGKGKILWGKTARQVLLEQKLRPDFETDQSSLSVDYIHYVIQGRDVYFVCNQQEKELDAQCTFRVAGRQPELWNPLTGQREMASAFQQHDGRTTIPLHFAPNGSQIIVFDQTIPQTQSGLTQTNFPAYGAILEISGPWIVRFDTRWGGPEEIIFDDLISWNSHPQQGIQDYSGKAVYCKTFTLDPLDSSKSYLLDLGRVEDSGIAGVTLNGTDLGVVWTSPFRVDITKALKSGANTVEIAVVNSWRNRLLADEKLRKEKRLTNTNIQVKPDWKSVDSGLLGPVKILQQQ
ncbi:MAG: glycosyl hydrolase [Anaerohalosphaeraceae bacterium]